jgi:hypothetical protein
MFVSNMYIERYFCRCNLSYARGMRETTVSAEGANRRYHIKSAERRAESNLSSLPSFPPLTLTTAPVSGFRRCVSRKP